MKETYLSRDLRETATQRFSSQVKELQVGNGIRRVDMMKCP